MSERQYVGARYVPKFYENPNGTAEWKANVPYEAMTIVTYLGNSYTSKIPVPPESEAPDTDTLHWVLTSAYNYQLEEYKKAHDSLKENVEQYEKKTDSFLYPVSNDINKKTIIFIGDSYGDFSMPNTFSHWYEQFQTISSKYKFKKYYNMSGGSGFGVKGNDNRNWYEALQYVITSNNINFTDITDIYFVGLANDLSAFTSVKPIDNSCTKGIDNVINYVNSNCPNAIIHILPVGRVYHGQTTNGKSYVFELSMMLEQLRNRYGGIVDFDADAIYCVYSYQFYYENRNLYSDNHPNYYAGTLIARYVLGRILGTHNNTLNSCAGSNFIYPDIAESMITAVTENITLGGTLRLIYNLTGRTLNIKLTQFKLSSKSFTLTPTEKMNSYVIRLAFNLDKIYESNSYNLFPYVASLYHNKNYEDWPDHYMMAGYAHFNVNAVEEYTTTPVLLFENNILFLFPKLYDANTKLYLLNMNLTVPAIYL